MRPGPGAGPPAGARARAVAEPAAGPCSARAGPPAVYFLSDYGTADEFVGVVHAVLHRLAPRCR